MTKSQSVSQTLAYEDSQSEGSTTKPHVAKGDVLNGPKVYKSPMG